MLRRPHARVTGIQFALALASVWLTEVISLVAPYAPWRWPVAGAGYTYLVIALTDKVWCIVEEMELDCLEQC